MHTHTHRRRFAALAATLLALAMIPAAAATAGDGGVSSSGDSGSGGGHRCTNKNHAKLDGGKAIPPCSAPRRVVKVIKAANEIRHKPYRYGGGHGEWRDSGYDCSGAVSYALHGGDLLGKPLDSSGLARWGSRGKGNWITVYAHSGHAYAVIAGLRWDTSMTKGDGLGWSSERRSADGYKKRHKGRL